MVYSKDVAPTVDGDKKMDNGIRIQQMTTKSVDINNKAQVLACLLRAKDALLDGNTKLGLDIIAMLSAKIDLDLAHTTLASVVSCKV